MCRYFAYPLIRVLVVNGDEVGTVVRWWWVWSYSCCYYSYVMSSHKLSLMVVRVL